MPAKTSDVKPTVAWLIIGNHFTIALQEYPNWFRRITIKLLFGWNIELEKTKSQKQLLHG